MSLYVQWLNLIKERATAEWLTVSQKVAYDRILTRWQGASFVNVHGPPGCGKSFLARILANEHGYIYTHDLSCVPESSDNVIVDNADYTRLMRPMKKKLGLGRVILVTSTAVRDPMPRAEIKLTEKDVKQALHNLYKYCGVSFTKTDPHGPDLARIIRAEVVARGGAANVT